MIIEHEFLEQIAETSFNWPLTRALEFVAQHKDPWPVLQALYADKCVTFHCSNGEAVPTWKVEEILTNRDAAGAEVVVKVTETGIKGASY